MATEKDIDALDLLALNIHSELENRGQYIGIVEAKRWIYDDFHWRLCTAQDISDLQPFVYAAAKKRGISYAEKKAAIWETVDAKATMRTRFENLDSEGPLVACDNCLVNLETGETTKNHPDFWVTRRLKVNYDPAAECPKWIATLNRIWSDIPDPADRQAMINFLQEWFGTALIRSDKVLGSRALKRGLFVHGPQSTGKTTIAEVLRVMFGNKQDKVSAATMGDLSKDFGLEPLLIAQAIITDEAFNEGNIVRSNVLKKLITNEPFQVAIKGQTNLNNFTFKGPIMFTANSLPTFNDTSGAIYDRLIAVPINRQFGPEDAHTLEGHGNVRDMLVANGELPGILNWACKGYERVVERGKFVLPKPISTSTLDWRFSNDPAFSFLKKCTTTDPTHACGEVALAALASHWARLNHGGQHQGMSVQIMRNKLASTIIEALPSVRRRGEASTGDVHYTGLALNAYALALWDAAATLPTPPPMVTADARKMLNVPLLT